MRDLATVILLELTDEAIGVFFGDAVFAESSTVLLSAEDTVVVGVGSGVNVGNDFLHLSLVFLGEKRSLGKLFAGGEGGGAFVNLTITIVERGDDIIVGDALTGKLTDGVDGVSLDLLPGSPALSLGVLLELSSDGLDELLGGTLSTEDLLDFLESDGLVIAHHVSDGTSDLLLDLSGESTLSREADTEDSGSEERNSEEFHCVVVWELCLFYLLLQGSAAPLLYPPESEKSVGEILLKNLRSSCRV